MIVIAMMAGQAFLAVFQIARRKMIATEMATALIQTRVNVTVALLVWHVIWRLTAVIWTIAMTKDCVFLMMRSISFAGKLELSSTKISFLAQTLRYVIVPKA